MECSSLGLLNEAEMKMELLKVDSFSESFCKSLDAVQAKAEAAAKLRVKLVELKSSLRIAEEDFVKVLRVKTEKESRLVEMKKLISTKKARIEDIRRTIDHQRKIRDDYKAAASNSSEVARKMDQAIKRKVEIQHAEEWFNNALGFHIESGRGVKFSFANIDKQNVNAQYSFTVRYEKEAYALLACDPELDGTKEMVFELNRTNGLYEFVRTMRRKFQEAALSGCAPRPDVQPESSAVSSSAPVASASTCCSDAQKNLESLEGIKRPRKEYPSGSVKGIQSSLPVRSSPRLKAKK